RNNKWELEEQASNVAGYGLRAVWMKPDGSEGWAVGWGVVVRYRNNKWELDKQASSVAGATLLSAVWMKPDGSEGWAVGSGGVLRYRPSVGQPIFRSPSSEALRKLEGPFTLRINPPVVDPPRIELIHDGKNYLTPHMYSIKKTSGVEPEYLIDFNDAKTAVLKSLEGKKAQIRIGVNYYHPSFPQDASYYSDPIIMVADPWWKPLIVYGLAVVGLNFCLLLLAIPFPWVRRVMLHPVGSAVLGLVVGKYLLTDALIRFVQPI